MIVSSYISHRLPCIIWNEISYRETETFTMTLEWSWVDPRLPYSTSLVPLERCSQLPLLYHTFLYTSFVWKGIFFQNTKLYNSQMDFIANKKRISISLTQTVREFCSVINKHQFKWLIILDIAWPWGKQRLQIRTSIVYMIMKDETVK